MPKRKPEIAPAAISAPEQPPKRAPGRPFQPGQSGNPSGKPKAVREVVELARKHTITAVNALVRIAREGEEERARVAAAQVILDRGWGKAAEKVDVSVLQKPTEELEREIIEQLVAEGKVLKP